MVEVGIAEEDVVEVEVDVDVDIDVDVVEEVEDLNVDFELNVGDITNDAPDP